MEGGGGTYGNWDMSPLHTRPQQLTQLPRLRRPMAQIAILALLIRRMQMRTKHLDPPLPPLTPLPTPSPTPTPPAFINLHHRPRHPLPHIPIPPPKRRRPPIQPIPPHTTLDDPPSTQDDQPPAKDTGVVEFAIGEDVGGGGAQGEVVGVDPAFLESDDVPGGRGRGEALRDGEEPLGAVRGDVF